MNPAYKFLVVFAILVPIFAMTSIGDDSAAPDGTIYGHVYDADTKQPLSQAFVYSQDAKCSKQTTDKEGYYAIEGCFSPSTSYTLQCTKFGYESSSKMIVTDAQGKAEVPFYIKNAAEEEKSDAQEWFAKGNDLYKQGNYDDAAKAYAKAIDLNPSLRKDMWFDIGFAFLMAKKYPEAVDVYNEVLESDPSNAEVLLWKGISLRDSDKKEEAIRCFDEIIDANPRYSSAWNNKAMCLMDLGRQEEAIQCFDSAIKYADSNDAATAYYDNKGNALFKMGQSEEALKAYDKAIETSPGYGNPQLDKIVALRKLGRIDEAKELQNKYDHATEFIEDWETNWGH